MLCYIEKKNILIPDKFLRLGRSLNVQIAANI